MTPTRSKRVAFIVDQMFEDSEFRVPYDRVKQAGHQPTIVGQEAGTELRGKRHDETIRTEKAIDDVSADDFDALVIPGGYSPDKLRENDKMVRLVRNMVESGKPVGAICHAGWMLAEADVAGGRTMTSWPSIKKDLVNAGARWVDQEVVVDRNLVTSRKPADLDAFCRELLGRIEHGPGERAPGPRLDAGREAAR